jgi:hypothetical protein
VVETQFIGARFDAIIVLQLLELATSLDLQLATQKFASIETQSNCCRDT